MKFQVILMAGGLGSRMNPLVKDVPKCLLPVANKPMIRHVLKYLETHGMKDILVITKDTFLNQIKSQLVGFSGIELVSFDGENVGTADVLRKFRDKIKSDFIVISADLITDAPLNDILELHISNNSSCTALLFDCQKTDDIRKPKAEIYAQQFFGFCDKRIVFMIEAADVDEEVEIHGSLLRKFPKMTFSTTFQSGHLFVFKKWVVDLLADKTNISSVQGELVPFLVKAQSRTSPKYDVSSYMTTNQYVEQFRSTTTNGILGVNCLFYNWSGLCIRANNVPNYVEVNKQILKTVPDKISPSAVIEPKNVGDSIVGEGTRFEGISMKKSVIGKNCIIGKNVKINNSVIMDGVTISDGCKLDGVVICNNAILLENCTLKDCEVEAGYKVERGTDEKNQKLIENKYMEGL